MGCPGTGKPVGAIGGSRGPDPGGSRNTTPPSVLLRDTSKLTRNLLGCAVAVFRDGGRVAEGSLPPRGRPRVADR